MRSARVCLLLCAFFLSVPAGVTAETFRAQLQPRPGTGSTGSGSAVLELDASETQIAYTIEYSGLGSLEIAAHIHSADGTILFPLPLGSPKVGVWSNPGNINVLLLRSNTLFVLVHTEGNPGGELRGDIADDVVGNPVSTWSALKSGYGPPVD